MALMATLSATASNNIWRGFAQCGHWQIGILVNAIRNEQCVLLCARRAAVHRKGDIEHKDSIATLWRLFDLCLR
jgi:hypothetical protein